MPNTSIMRSIPLDARPILLVAQVGVHGDKPAARYAQEAGIWSLHLYLYRADLRIGDEHHEIQPGCLALAPPETVLEYRLHGRSEHFYALFNTGPVGELRSVPAIQALGEYRASFEAEFQELIALCATHPLRAEIRLWDMLLRAAELGGGEPRPRLPAPVERAMRLVEQRLASPLPIDELAGAAVVSHSHLIKLFRTHLGAPPVRYIGARRLEIAANLLRHTSIPVKSIAEQVGIPDLHLFNKMVRKAFGASPRSLRQGAAKTP